MAKQEKSAGGDPPDARDLYPASPDPPPPLGLLTGAYRLRVVLVLFSLLLFLAVYLALLAGSGYLFYFCLEMEIPEGRAVLFKIGAIVGAAMLFLFLFKGLFKRSRLETDNLLEVRAAE